MLEFSHEANAAMAIIHEKLRQLTDCTLNTHRATQDFQKDSNEFLHRLSKLALEVSRSFEIFVAATAESARTTGVFPVVIPKRPQAMHGAGYVLTPVDGSGKTTQIARLSQPAPVSRRQTNDEQFNSALLHSTSFSVPMTPPQSNPPAALVSPAPSNQHGQVLISSPFQPQAGFDSNVVPTGISYKPTGDAVEAAVTAGAYLHLEVLVRQTLACDAAWYSYDGGEDALALCLFNEKPKSPSSARIPVKNGIVGAVLKCGMAINVQPDRPTPTNCLSLCVPIFPPYKRMYPIGAVLLQNKATNTPFTPDDERLASSWTELAAHFMTAYPIDLLRVYFDPFRMLRKKANPFHMYEQMGFNKPGGLVTSEEKDKRLLDELLATCGTMMSAEAMISGDLIDAENLAKEGEQKKLRRQSTVGGAGLPKYSKKDVNQPKPGGTLDKALFLNTTLFAKKLSSAVAAHPPPLKVFRCVHHNHFSTTRQSALGGTGISLQTQNMIEVSDYVSNLEECWRRATDDLQGIELEHVAQMEDYRARKKKLKMAQQRVVELEAQKGQFESKYETLKRELAVLCGKSIDVAGENDDDLLGGVEVPPGGFINLSRFTEGSPTSPGKPLRKKESKSLPPLTARK